MKGIGLWLVLLGGVAFPALVHAQSASLFVEISSPGNGIAGTNTSYQVSIGNSALVAATGVTISAPVPTGLTFVSAQQVNGPAFTCTGGSTVTCTGASLPGPGGADLNFANFNFTYKIASSVADGFTISNSVTVSAANASPYNSQASLNISAQAGLNLTKTAPETVAPGGNLTYTITLSNTGPSDAQQVSLSDPIPYNTTFVSFTQTSGPHFTCTNSTMEGATETCNAATLAVNATVVFSLVVNVPVSAPNNSSIENSASATTSTSLGDHSPPYAYAFTTVAAPPFTCTAHATAIPARGESTTELTADLVVTCTGGSPAAAGNPLSTNTITIGFNANVSSRILNSGTGATEALLLIDEPQPGSQFPCDPGVTCAAYGNGTGAGYYGADTSTPQNPANRNVYQGVITPISAGPTALRPALASNNSITWSNVPVDPPGPATRTYRFTNLRLDPTSGTSPLAVTYISTAAIPPVIAGNLATVLQAYLPGNTPLPIATPQTSLAGTVRDAADATPQTVGVGLPVSPLGLPPTRVATLRFASAFPGADKPRTATFVNPDTSPPPADQNVPGKNYGSESGFYSSTFGPNGSGGDLGTAGLADNGTRYMAVFSNIPAGFSLYVDLHSATTANGNVARLISTDANGAGPFTVSGSGTMAQLTVNDGTATAVWEVLQNSTSSADQFDFGVYLASVAGITSPPPPMAVQMRYAPFSPATSMPLFSGTSASLTLVTFQPPPQLFVAPATLSFSGTVGGQAPAAQTLSIGSTSAIVPVVFSVAGGSLSYQIQPSSGTAPASISVAPVTTNLAAGTYQDAITIAGNSGTAGARIPVTLTLAAAPVITSFSPANVGAGGPAFTLTVNGSNFASGTLVEWNGSALPTNFVGPSQLTATVAASLIAKPGNVPITALTPDQSLSNTVNFTVTSPQLTALGPSTVVGGGPGFTLSLTGTGFQQGAAVNIGASTLQPATVSSNAITVAVPANLIAQAGTLSVSVTNPGNVLSNALTLTVTAGPAITALTPSSITAGSPALSLTITGSGFAAGDVAKWNGQSLSTTLVSATQLTAQVPASLIATAGTASVTVATSDGASSNALPLTIGAVPSITSLNPSSAAPGSGAFTLTVQGSNFASGTSVLWNGQALASAVVSATQLTAQVPAALIASAGTVSVSVASADGVSSNALPFTLQLPQLTGVGVTAPPSATSGQNQPITVNLGSTYPVDLLGTLTLTFAPQGNLPDDPSIQFQNGSRVYTFTVPGGTAPAPVQVMISTGTVAGTITISPAFTASGTDVTPAGTTPEIIQIAPAAPSLSQPTCTANNSGFTVILDGYTNTRDVSQANFSFQAAPGASLGTAQLSLTVTPIFSGWFGGSASATAGGEFQYTQPFNIQGSISTIASVSVTLTNSTGTSNSVSCQLP